MSFKEACEVFFDPFYHMDDPAAYHLAMSISGKKLSYSEASAWWRNRAFQDIGSDILGYIRLLLDKFIYIFQPNEFSVMGTGFSWFKERCWPLKLPIDARMLFIFAILSPLVLRRTGKAGQLSKLIWPLTILICYCGTFVVFFVSGRYRMPIMPTVIILSSVSIAGFVKLVSDYNRSKNFKDIIPVIIAVALFVCSYFLYEAKSAPYAILQSSHAENRHLGMNLYEQGRYEEAVEVYKKSLMERDDPNTRGNLANALKKLGRIDEAMREYQIALQMKPNDGLIWYNYGNLFNDDLKNPREAKKAFLKAIEYSPRFSEAYFNLGHVCLQLKEYDIALKAYQDFVRISPPNSPLVSEAKKMIQHLKSMGVQLK